MALPSPHLQSPAAFQQVGGRAWEGFQSGKACRDQGPEKVGLVGEVGSKHQEANCVSSVGQSGGLKAEVEGWSLG